MPPPPTNRPPSDNDVLVRVEDVGKKYCRDLKKSLWYGMKDIAAELLPGERDLERHATLRSGEFWAVDDVSFELRRGESLGLIGRNGAGKTTLLKMLNGLIKPDKGRIQIRGRVGALIALGAGFNPILTGRENIYVNGSVLGLGKKELDARLEDIVEFAELSEFIDSPVQGYSTGMAVRLGFSVATALRPDILLIDEVLAVGDAAFRLKAYQRIAAIAHQSTTVFVSHSLPQVSKLCTHALLLTQGRATSISNDLGRVFGLYARQQSEQLPVRVVGADLVQVLQFDVYPKSNSRPICQAYDPREPPSFEIRSGSNYIFDARVLIHESIDQFHVALEFTNSQAEMVAQCFSINRKTNFRNKAGFPIHLSFLARELPFGQALLSVNLRLFRYTESAPEVVEPLSIYENICRLEVSSENQKLGSAPIHLSGDWLQFHDPASELPIPLAKP